MNTESEQFDQLPEALIERLREQDRRLSMLTPRIDNAISQAARAQFEARHDTLSPRSERTVADRRWHYPAAAAAAVALVALLIVRPFDDSGPALPALANDVDRSGRVDVLDAFALARARASDPDTLGADRIDELMREIVALDNSGSVL